jgi:hypothetical protein
VHLSAAPAVGLRVHKEKETKKMCICAHKSKEETFFFMERTYTFSLFLFLYEAQSTAGLGVMSLQPYWKPGDINQILEIRMQPVSQTQPEFVFKNTTPLPGGLAKRKLLGIHTMDFLGIPNLLQCGRLLRMTFFSHPKPPVRIQ